MSAEKIATKVILSDGRTYTIGTTGLNEVVSVKLTAPTSEDWASKVIVVQNITQATSEEYALSGLGECKFTIPMGNVYSIVYPVLSSYKQPINATFTATLASRSVEYTYSTEEVMYEQINISAQVINGDIAELNGKVVSALSDNGNAYAAEFANGKVTLRIPYGEKYKITLPELDGLVHDCTNIQMTAGIPSRFILIHYSEGLLGFFGIDDDGNQYSIEKIEQMVADGEDTSIIHYIGYNDAALAIADRGDGTVGCGVCFAIPFTKKTLAWASKNVEFDITRLPFGGFTGNPSDDNRSSYNTTQIIITGEEMGVLTPAASEFRKNRIIYGGVERQGNLVAPGVIQKMSLNKESLKYLGTLLNVAIPDFSSGLWSTSCQGTASDKVVLAGTELYKNHSAGGSKSAASSNCLCVYDL